MALSPQAIYDAPDMARRRKPANQKPATPGTLAHLIQTKREALDWSQMDVAMHARDLGETLDPSDVSDIERGATKEPRYSRMRGLSQALDIPIGELYAALDADRRPLDWSTPIADTVHLLVERMMADGPHLVELVKASVSLESDDMPDVTAIIRGWPQRETRRTDRREEAAG